MAVIEAHNPFFTDVAQGIEQAAQDAGLSLILCNSNQNAEREVGYLDLREEQRVPGVLITPLNPEIDRLFQLPHGGPLCGGRPGRDRADPLLGRSRRCPRRRPHRNSPVRSPR